MNRRPALIGVMILAGLLSGCGKTAKETPRTPAPQEPLKNPVTSAPGPIGQGGDAAAMAVRRASEQMKAVNDMRQLGTLFQVYRTSGEASSTEGFCKHLEQDRETAALSKAVKEGRYVVQIPKMPDASGILAYEKDADYQGTRVVVMTDGSVQKTMPESEFQKALKAGK